VDTSTSGRYGGDLPLRTSTLSATQSGYKQEVLSRL